jgi:hypothetical protein
MSTPEPERYGLDPISEAIGELKADVRTLVRELGELRGDLVREVAAVRSEMVRSIAAVRSEMATKAELRVWGALITLLLGGVLAKLLHG